MDAVTLLHDHIDMYKLLEHYHFDKLNKEGDMIRACCKLHGGNNPTSFVVNTRNNLYYCHTGGCGGGDAYHLVQKLEGISFPESVKWIAEFFRVDITNLHIAERQEQSVRELRKWVEAMKSRQKKSLEEFSLAEEVKQVAKFRDFEEDTLRLFNLGWVEKTTLLKRDRITHFTLHNRLVFPIIQGGVQVGVSLRKIKSGDYPKWSHQPTGLETKNILYNYDACIQCDEIVVVEGLVDVWAYYEIGVIAVATFGAHLTDEQYKLLIRTGADITLSYDGDEAGQLATKKAIDMLRYKANVRCVVFDDGEDPASITREELAKRYENRRRC